MRLDTSCFGGIVIVLLFDINVDSLASDRLNLVINLPVSANFFSFDRLILLFEEWTVWRMSSRNSAATVCIIFTIHVSR